MRMNDSMGLGFALAAMQPHDGHRYDGLPLRSALPDAPTVPHRPTLRERLRALLRPTPVRDLVVVHTGDRDLAFQVTRDAGCTTVVPTVLRGPRDA